MRVRPVRKYFQVLELRASIWNPLRRYHPRETKPKSKVVPAGSHRKRDRPQNPKDTPSQTTQLTLGNSFRSTEKVPFTVRSKSQGLEQRHARHRMDRVLHLNQRFYLLDTSHALLSLVFLISQSSPIDIICCEAFDCVFYTSLRLSIFFHPSSAVREIWRW